MQLCSGDLTLACHIVARNRSLRAGERKRLNQMTLGVTTTTVSDLESFDAPGLTKFVGDLELGTPRAAFH
jgi:hypothetical protein